MAAVVVGTPFGLNGQDNTPQATSGTVASDETLVAFVFSRSTITGVSDDQSQTWTAREGPTASGSGTGGNAAIYTCANSFSGTLAVSLAFTSFNFFSIIVVRTTGGTYADSVMAFGTSGSPSSGATAAMSGDDGLALGCIQVDGGSSLTSPTTGTEIFQHGDVMDGLIASDELDNTETFTMGHGHLEGENWFASAITFSASGGGGVPPSLLIPSYVPFTSRYMRTV